MVFGGQGTQWDDKCGISVSMPSAPPVVAMVHSMVCAILPAGTEMSVADHDYYVCLKITSSLTAVLNSGEEPSQSLLSGGPDGQSGAFFSLHCALFAKSNCFNHMALSLYILHSEIIKKLFMDFDDAMSYINWFEADGGGDHNFNHLQNFCVHLAFFILSKADKLMMYQSDDWHSYINALERLMAIAYIGIANHTTRLDPDTPMLLLDIIHNTNSMKQVQDAIAEYEAVRKDAIKLVMRVCLHEQPPTDCSVGNNDKNGLTETFVANNHEGGSSEPNNNVEERS
eukprot:1947078-Ditylum_brightwellii.AAC.1